MRDSTESGHNPARRRLLRTALGLGGVAALGGLAAVFSRDAVINPCRATLPASLAAHPLVQAAWEGLDPAHVWDVHAHLAGTGDSGSGIMISPRMLSPLNPLEYLQRLFYLNAGCAHDAPGRVDESYVARMENLMEGFPPGAKLMLFAFDHVHDEHGVAQPERSAFYVPDRYARDVARTMPERFEWVCSIHPARPDAIDALQAAVADGARAVKWLPPAQGIDPASPAYDRFYRALADLQLPLISHVGEEQAVAGAERPEFGNPLRLRRALNSGVKVVMAHCASHGEDVDFERPSPTGAGPRVSSFSLFARLMEDDAYKANLFGDISAIVLRNRDADTVRTLLERTDWHARLLYGSDYPLPGVIPLISIAGFARDGLLDTAAVAPLEEIRAHNPLLFNFVLMRSLSHRGQGFSPRVFETRTLFDRPATALAGAAVRSPA